MAHHRERQRCLKELGLKEPASEDDIRKAYKAAAIKYHPDKNIGMDTTKEFQRINTAYKFLTEGDAFLNLMREQPESAEFNILRFLFPWLFQPQTFRPHNPFYGYYDNMSDDSDDDDDNWVPFSTYAAQQKASGASQYYKNNTSFSHASAQHGQFFQETQAKTKTNKKKKKDAKRAAKLAADRERESAQTSSANTRSQNREERVKSPTPDLPGKQQTDTSQQGKEKEKSQSPENSSTSSNTEVRKDNSDDQVNKKSKKQILMEQKQREKELKELNEELLRQEKEKKEKMEKKRAAQEEKERQEREAREQEEQQKEEEALRQAEELRILLEKKKDEKKRKKREEMQMKKLLEEFDSCTFLDENGDFKYTDPEVKNIICRDDINQLGNATNSIQRRKLDTINGLDSESLMKLQEVKQANLEPQSHQEKVLGSPNHEKLGPIGSRPQNEHTNHRRNPNQQYNNQQYNNQRYNQGDYQYQQQHHHPEQQQQQYHRPEQQQQQYHRPQQQHQHHQQQQWQYYNRPPPPRQPTFQAPFWSPTQPPPPLHNMNTSMPRPSGRFNHGHSNNMRFQNNGIHSRTFTSRGFQGKV